MANFEVLLLLSIVVEEGQKSFVVNVNEHVFLAVYIRHFAGFGGHEESLLLFAGEDVYAGDVHLSSAVLSGLGNRDGIDLEGLTVDEDVATGAQRGALSGDGERGSGRDVVERLVHRRLENRRSHVCCNGEGMVGYGPLSMNGQ